MKVKFTKASKKDRNLVTVSLTALRNAGVLMSGGAGHFIYPDSLRKGEQFVLTIYQGTCGNRRKVLFTVNREGKTAASTNWSLYNRPRVGRGVQYSVASNADIV